MQIKDLKTGKIEQVAACHFNISKPYNLKRVCRLSDRLWLNQGEFELVDLTDELRLIVRQQKAKKKNRVHKMSHGKALKVWQLRYDHEESIANIAKQFGVTQSSIHGILSGNYYPEAEQEFKYGH
ncbi:MAG: hypothetical protein NE330_15095 [Lentisphaeraceae bacterium]|nr:hypothetical protein [Lentisphaeraceae bacterium]